MLKRERLILKIALCVLVISSFQACVPVSRLRYLNDINEVSEPIVNPRSVKTIMPFDKIYVKIFSIDDKTNQLFNSTTYMTQNANIFLVDETGCIDYPLTGKVEVAGMTPDQAAKKITTTLTEYVSVASVIVQFAESSITVMGEVNRQGMFTYTQDKLSIYEAIALGGGITQYGDRKNVVLVRQEGDNILYHKLDLSSSRIIQKDFYYVHSNDIIIVEPLKSVSWYKFNNNNFMTFISTVSSFLAIYVLLNR